MNISAIKKDFLRGGLFCIIISVGFLFKAQAQQVDTLPPPVDTILVPTDSLAIVTDSLPAIFTVIGVGDMMLGTNYPSPVYLPPNDGKDLLKEVIDTLLNADVTFGNLEGTLFDEGGKPKTCRDSTICYVFRTPAKYVDRFVEAGFDVLSIANNHSGDFGAEGRTQTKANLQQAGIAYAGLINTDETVIFERNGLKFGLAAFAPNGGTCDIRNIPRAQEIVQQLATQVDVVIVSFHGGAEGPKNQHVTKEIETFYGENRGNVYEFAHAVIDAGADIVFGHGPHITRAIELYNDRFIAYSLGNFCTYGRFNLIGLPGVAPIIKLEINREGAFLSGRITPIYQQKTHGPKIDPQKRAIKLIQELTKADFPDTPLIISANGKITKKEITGDPLVKKNEAVINNERMKN
ncbi:MAG: CapA family protein [Saprospiraceae bacterium]